jgi:hypothetical protein
MEFPEENGRTLGSPDSETYLWPFGRAWADLPAPRPFIEKFSKAPRKARGYWFRLDFGPLGCDSLC